MSDSGLPSSVDDPEGGKKASYGPGGQAFIPDNTVGNYNVTSNAEATAAVYMSEREDIQIPHPVQESSPLHHGAQGGTTSWHGDYGQAEGGHGEACGDNPSLGQRSPIEGALGKRSQREGTIGQEPPREEAQSQVLPRKLTQGQVLPREGPLGQVLSREQTLGQGLPREGTLRQGLPREGALGQGLSREGTLGQGLSREGTLGQGLSREQTLGQGLPREGTLRQGLPREGALGQGLSREGTLGQGLPREGTLGQGLPREGTLGQGLSREQTLGQGLPREQTLGQGLPREGTLGQGLPREGALGQGLPREQTLGQGLPREGTLGQGLPREQTLGQGLPREGTLGQGLPREQTLGQGLSKEGTLGQGLPREQTLGQGPQIQENNLRLLNQDLTQTGPNEGERDADTLVSRMFDLSVEELGPLSMNESVTQTESSTRDSRDHGAENQGTEKKQLEASPRHGDQAPNLQHGYSNSQHRLSSSTTSLPGAMPSSIPADESRIPQSQISVPVPYLMGPPQGASPSISGSSVPHYQQGFAEVREPREPFQHQYQFPAPQPLPINPSLRQPLNQPLYMNIPNIPHSTPYQPERPYAAHFQPVAYLPSPRGGPAPPPPPLPMVRDGRSTPEGWSELEIAREGRGRTAQASADSCTTCIGSLLDNTGQSNEVTRKKRSILFSLLPSSSQFSAKTIIGLAERLLQLSPEELQYMIEHPTTTVHLRTCVHVAIRDMRSEGKKVGHLVEYFMADYSKRVDIVKLVLQIHRSCAFCQIHYNRLP